MYEHNQDNAVKTTCKSLSDEEDSPLWTLKSHTILAFGTELFWKTFLKMGVGMTVCVCVVNVF